MRAIEKNGRSPLVEKGQRTHNAQYVTHPVFNGSNTPARAAGGEKNATTHYEGEPFAPRKSRIGFHSHKECMEEAHEYVDELGKQGGKNPRKIPKFSHERFSRTIEKISNITPTHSS